MYKTEPRPAAHKPKIFDGWYLVSAAWIMAFLVSATSVGIFFKPLLDEFGWDRATLSLVSSITMLIFAVLSPFLGRLIDRFGPRAILLVSAAGQTLSSVSYGLANGIGAVFAGRLLYELKPTHAAQVLVNRWFVRQRGRALGILSTGIPLGQLVLSPVSQYLIITWGWRETLFFWAGVTALLVLPLALMIRDRPQDKGLLPDGDTFINQQSTPIITAPPATGRAERDFSLFEAVRQKSFWLLGGTHLICGITCGLMATHTVIFATDLGYSAIIGALFLSIQGAVSLLGVLVTGWMSDRMRRNRVLSLTHLIRSLSMLVLATSLFAGFATLPVLYLAMAIFGFGWFTTSPLMAGLVADLWGYQRMGTIMGLILSTHIVGTAIGTYAGGLTFQITGSYRDIFLAAGIMELLACIMAFMIHKEKGALS